MSASSTHPDLWRIETLGEHLELQSEKINPQNSPDNVFFYVGLENIVSDAGELGRVTPTSGVEIRSTKNSFTEGQILYGRLRPNLNKVYLAERNGICSTDIWVLQASEFVNTEFASYYLRSPFVHYRATQRATGANLPRLSTRAFETIPLPLPPLHEQERIVALLRHADRLRQARRDASIKLTEKLIPSLFDAMFSTRVAKEQDWEMQPIGDLGDVSYGLTVNRKRRGSEPEHPYLRVANVYRWALDLDDISTIGTLDGDLDKYTLQQGDVLVVEGHANPDELGRAAVWDDEIPNCLHQNHLLRVRPNVDMITPNYVCGCINSSYGKDHMLRHGKTSSGLNTINSTVLSELPVYVAPLSLQLQFEKLIRQYKAVLGLDQATNHRFDYLQQSLLTRAFTGELTEVWREAHRDALEAAAAERDALLGIERTVPAKEPARTQTTPHPRRKRLLEALTQRQRHLLTRISEEYQADRYVTAESLADEHDLDADGWSLRDVHEALTLFEQAALIQRVRVEYAPSDATHYVPAQRLLVKEQDEARDLVKFIDFDAIF